MKKNSFVSIEWNPIVEDEADDEMMNHKEKDDDQIILERRIKSQFEKHLLSTQSNLFLTSISIETSYYHQSELRQL